jgi:DNA-nicking Smr family endonuclease
MKLSGDVVKPVKIITGKGKHAKKGPCLKPMFENWCKKLKSKNKLDYDPIPDNSTGYGSFVVYYRLKNL